jgi:hypothetical protein
METTMVQGMVWFRSNKLYTFEESVVKACQYYRMKYQKMPTLILVHPSEFMAKEPITTIDDIKVKVNRGVLPGHIWIGQA